MCGGKSAFIHAVSLICPGSLIPQPHTRPVSVWINEDNASGLPITYFYDGLDDSHIADAVNSADELSLPDRTIRVARMLDEMPDGDVKDKMFGLIKALSKAT